MPKVTDAHLQARRRQILAAALACFARKGFHQASMQDICEEAQFSPGAVYRYFRGKDEIIEAISDESRRSVAVLIAAALDETDPRLMIEAMASTVIQLFEAPAATADLWLDVEVWAEALRNPRIHAILGRGLGSHRAVVEQVVRRAQAAGAINAALEPEATARVMLSLVEGLVLQKALDPEVDVRSYVAAATAMLTGSFWLSGTRADAVSRRGEARATDHGEREGRHDSIP